MLLKALRSKPKSDRAPVTARPCHAALVILPAKMGDTAAIHGYVRPLRDKLVAIGLGDVVGHRLKPGRGDEPSGLEIDLVLADPGPRSLQSVGHLLDAMDAPVGSTVEFTETGLRHVFGRTEGLAIDIDVDADWGALVEVCTEAMGTAAIYQGSRRRGTVRSLYFYGENYVEMQTIARCTSKELAATRRLT